ncbi:MAG: hypothetical protein H6710_17165 [Myxococcales bacterium]|nr:hypothetical protein [Myxococcales bacterium]MCB9704928.1 hypothetical protein [Myxococcales bacterium]
MARQRSLAPPRSVALAVALTLAGCTGGPAATTTLGAGDPTSASSGAGSTGGAGSTSGAGTGTGATTGATTEASVGGSASGADLPLLDVGVREDLGSAPAGCGGKIDFVFAIANSWDIEPFLPQLQKSLPGLITGIEEAFDDFDVHVLVANANGGWGSLKCPIQECPVDGGCAAIDAPDYPCWYVHEQEVPPYCDTAEGAGVLFPAGKGATNAPCELAGGRRYITSEEPDIVGAFECIADLGTSGDWRTYVGWGSAQALSSAMNQPGGCNEGFLRDDALLVLTVVFYGGEDSPYNPKVWADMVLDAKGGDQDAVTVITVISDRDQPDAVCPPETKSGSVLLHEFASYFDHRHLISLCEPSYVPGFEDAVDVVLDVCAGFGAE